MTTKEAVKHTPGPWDTEEEFYGIDIVTHRDGETFALAEVGSCTHTDDDQVDDEDRANARLIAAAPEMLEELKKADRLLTMCLTLLSDQRIADFIPFGLKEDVEAFVYGNFGSTVIAKAEGRS